MKLRKVTSLSEITKNKTLGLLNLIALVSIGLFLFGCTQQPAQQATGSATQTPAQATQQALEQATRQPTQGTQTTPAGLSGLNFDQLLALSTPTECDVRVTVEGKTYTSKIYFFNKQYRYEMDNVMEGKTFKTIMISKNNVAYMDLNSIKQQTPEVNLPCDWLKIEPQASEAPQPAVNENQLREIPPTEFKCTPSAFGNEKFETPGKVCTSEEWMKALTGGVEIPTIPTS